MCPEANLPVEEKGFPLADILVRKLSLPTVAFGCAAHTKEDDSGVRKGRYGVTGGDAGIVSPKDLLCWQL